MAQCDRNIFTIPSATALRRKGVKLSKATLLLISDKDKQAKFEEDLEIYGKECHKATFARDDIQKYMAEGARLAKAKKSRLVEIQDEVSMDAKTLFFATEAAVIHDMVQGVSKAKRLAVARQKEEQKEAIFSRMMEILEGDQSKFDQFMEVYADMEASFKPAYVPTDE